MLLLFFIITTTFAENTFFPILLPKARQAKVRTMGESTVVEISHEGEFALDRQFVPSQRRLYEKLKQLKQEHNLKTVVIKADKRADAEHLVKVLDIMHGLDISEFAVTTEPEGAIGNE